MNLCYWDWQCPTHLKAIDYLIKHPELAERTPFRVVGQGNPRDSPNNIDYLCCPAFFPRD